MKQNLSFENVCKFLFRHLIGWGNKAEVTYFDFALLLAGFVMLVEFISMKPYPFTQFIIAELLMLFGFVFCTRFMIRVASRMGLTD